MAAGGHRPYSHKPQANAGAPVVATPASASAAGAPLPCAVVVAPCSGASGRSWNSIAVPLMLLAATARMG
jgi:hypothetical protein